MIPKKVTRKPITRRATRGTAKPVVRKAVTRRTVTRKPTVKHTTRKTVARRNTMRGYATGEKTKEFKFMGVKFNDGEKYTVYIDLHLRDKPEGKVFSASGTIKKRNSWVETGQCLESVYNNSDLKYNPIFAEIYELWKKYHLNDMHAGTPEQEEAIENYCKHGVKYDYEKVCNYLKAHNLYEVEYKGKPYQYGHAWLFEKIPEKDLKRIERLLQYGNTPVTVWKN